jgi:hypothetical protein
MNYGSTEYGSWSTRLGEGTADFSRRKPLAVKSVITTPSLYNAVYVLISKRCRESNQERRRGTFCLPGFGPGYESDAVLQISGFQYSPADRWHVGRYRYLFCTLTVRTQEKGTSFHLDKCQAGVDVEGLQQLLTVDIPPDMEIKLLLITYGTSL